ncbi:MAG: hypothetical protein ACI8YP_002701 [Algoriphagus sp.]
MGFIGIKNKLSQWEEFFSLVKNKGVYRKRALNVQSSGNKILVKVIFVTKLFIAGI